MTRVPKLVFFFNLSQNKVAIRECLKLNLLLIGLVDTNFDPLFSNFMIPINDNSVTVLYFLLKYMYRILFKNVLFFLSFKLF